MARIVVVGEGMLELTGTDEGWRLGYGGDTLNTAIHLARRGHTVALLTALGSDRFSHRLREAWIAEGLDAALILTHPTRHAGLYAIALDERGERSFTYWREASAAREMFELPASEAALHEAKAADLEAKRKTRNDSQIKVRQDFIDAARVAVGDKPRTA